VGKRAANFPGAMIVAASAAAAALLGAACEAEVTPPLSGAPGSAGTPATAAATAPAAIELVTAVAPPAGPELFGAPLSAAPAVPLDAVLAAPEKYAAAPVKIAARVARVCKKKGCWMTLAGEKGEPDPMVRVTFKDYGFFIPTDAEGARVTLEGVVSVSEETEAVSKHYAEDEGKDPATITGPRKKIAIEATGVELVRAGS
jgi:hypothetical protein